jgi:hypothetical protein
MHMLSSDVYECISAMFREDVDVLPPQVQCMHACLIIVCLLALICTLHHIIISLRWIIISSLD